MTLAFPKGESKKKEKARNKREKNRHTKATRVYVFEREGGTCRVCSSAAEDMHEIVFRSLGGKVSAENSIALCRSCHRLMQALRMVCYNVGQSVGSEVNAEEPLTFEKTW